MTIPLELAAKRIAAYFVKLPATRIEPRRTFLANVAMLATLVAAHMHAGLLG